MTANAEWKFDSSSTNTSNNFNIYIDYSRITTEGKYKSIWTLLDFRYSQPNLPNFDDPNNLEKEYKSSAQKRMVDCQASKLRTVAIYEYSEQMGKGKVVRSYDVLIKEYDWQIASADSFNERLINIACATNNNPKPSASSAQDTKLQKCIRLGLAPNSADFQQCMK